MFAIRSTPCRRERQGFDFQAMTSTEIKKRPGNVIAFWLGFIQPTATPQGGPQAIHRPQAIGDPLSGPSKVKTGNGTQWRNQARLHNSFTFIRPYALRMQPYAVRMHFFAEIEKPIKSRAESTYKKPYALYAPLLGVGPFLAFFLLREVHTVHTAAYGSHWNPALALLPVGIEALPARRNQKCIRRCIRLSGRKTPISPLLTECPVLGCLCPVAAVRHLFDDTALLVGQVIGVRLGVAGRVLSLMDELVPEYDAHDAVGHSLVDYRTRHVVVGARDHPAAALIPAAAFRTHSPTA